MPSIRAFRHKLIERQVTTGDALDSARAYADDAVFDMLKLAADTWMPARV